MPNIKLTYFDMHGGRAEPIRIALTAGGVPFEDERISFEQFGQIRGGMPFKAVPVFEIDGVAYTQTNAMLSYVGKLVGLYPEDPWEAYRSDEIMDANEDLLHKIVSTFGMKGDELKAAREKLTHGAITDFLKFLDTRLAEGGGEYFADKRLTVVDLKVFVQLRSFLAGFLDHVPTDLIATTAPKLMEFVDRVNNQKIVKDYYEGRL